MAASVVLLALDPHAQQRPGIPSSPYSGPLIDSHAHIVNYRSLLNEPVTARADDVYAAGLDRNNIRCVVGFHGVAFDQKSEDLLASARALRERYPGRFILFAEIFRDNPLEWFDAAAIAPLFDMAPFAGFGEIQFANPPLGDGAPMTPAPIVPPNAAQFLGLYDALGERRLFVMAHPASTDGMAEAIEHNPNVTWLVHGPQMHRYWSRMDELERFLETYPNIYYTVDFSESLPEFLSLTKSVQGAQSLRDFLDAMATNSSMYQTRMLATWRRVIEAHPDRFLWGTDMARPAWQWEPQVIDAIVKFSRSYIGALAPAAANKFAYQNADYLFGPCR